MIRKIHINYPDGYKGKVIPRMTIVLSEDGESVADIEFPEGNIKTREHDFKFV